MVALLLLCSTLLGCIHASPLHSARQDNFTVGQAVTVNAGTVQGAPSKIRPDVSAYLGIPFGQPPIGELRFSPPVAVSSFNSTVQATEFGPDCPSNHIPTHEAYIGGPAGEAILVQEAQTGRPLSEDCLSLNVWTKPQSGESSKAVLFWIFGGGFSIGNTACGIYDGSVFADENDVIVVSPNYRVNIFGFSGAPGLTQNVGLLDQRLALEWVRDNIAAFGGDPNRITVFGQSAGGASTDYLDIMYPNDPIAHGFIPQSGVATGAIGAGQSNETTGNNWYRASQNAGCGGQEAGAATVECMRTKSTDEILEAISSVGVTAIMSGFGPVQDDITVPSNAKARVQTGNFAKLPIMTGSTDDEASFFLVVLVAYTNLTKEEVEAIPIIVVRPLLDVITLVGFTCGAASASSLREQQGVTAYRYRFYGGNYSNIYINPIGSAYHTAELPIVFGTAEAVTGIENSAIEDSMEGWMRRAWAAFARDPENGPATELGWPKYNSLTLTEARLAYHDETTPSYISPVETDALCPAIDAVLSTVTTLEGLFSGIGKALTELVSGNGTEVLQLLQANPQPWTPTSITNLIIGLSQLS